MISGDRNLDDAIKRGYLITNSRRLLSRHYNYCEMQKKACLQVRIHGKHCDVCLDMLPDPDHRISQEGQKSAKLLFDWYDACRLFNRKPPRKRVTYICGGTDILITGIPAEDGNFIAEEIGKIFKKFSEDRFIN